MKSFILTLSTVILLAINASGEDKPASSFKSYPFFSSDPKEVIDVINILNIPDELPKIILINGAQKNPESADSHFYPILGIPFLECF